MKRVASGRPVVQVGPMRIGRLTLAKDGSDRGVGGWLAFFLVTLGIVTPLFMIVSVVGKITDPGTASLRPDLYRSLVIADIAGTAVAAGLCWFAAWRFLKVHNWTTVRIGIAVLWLLVPINGLVLPLTFSNVTGMPVGLLLQAGWVHLFLRPIAYAAVSTAYLLMSQRVRATYGAASPA
jgi:hypothetical protein